MMGKTNIFAVISIFLFVWRISDCATMKFHRDEREGNESIEENSAALSAATPDNVSDHSADDQADPKSSDAISEDRHEPLDSLVASLDGPLEQSIKEKRCKNERLVGSPRNTALNLQLARRDTTAGFLKRSCENCMNSAICKMKGKCENCKKICDKYQASLDRKEIQMDEPTREQIPDQIVGMSSRMNEPNGQKGGLSFEDTEYYTVGSFGPGPVHDLLAKLLNIKDTEHFEQLLILAKFKSKKLPKFEDPVIIDTAHIFTLNNGGPSKLNTEIHEVASSGGKVDDIAFKVDREIEKAIENKRRTSGISRLTPGEIDDIIRKVLTKKSRSGFNHNARNVDLSDQNKSKSITDKDQDDGEETIYLPYRPNYRENEEESPTRETNEENLRSNEDEVFVDNRFQQPETQEQIPDRVSLSEPEPSSNDGFPSPPSLLPIARSDFDAHRLAQKAPFHPDSDIMTTEPLPTTIFSRPRPPGPVSRQQSKERNMAESESFEPGQEPLHGSQTMEDRPQRPPLIPFKGKQEIESHISEHITQSPSDGLEHSTKHSRPPHGPPRDRINQGEAEEAAQLRQAFVTPKKLELYSASKSLETGDGGVYAPNYTIHERVADMSHVVGKKQDFTDAKNTENEVSHEEKSKQRPMKNDGVESENSPKLQQKAPFHPDSAIRTTEPPPTTVFSRIKAPIRTNEHKTKETGESIPFEATGNLPHRPPTVPSKAEPINESAEMERINEDETEETSQLRQSSGLLSNAFQTANGQQLKGHVDQIYAPNYGTHEMVPSYSRTFEELNSRDSAVGNEQNLVDAEGNQLQAKNVENEDFYEDKLKQWTRKNDGVQSDNSPRLEQKAPFHPDSAIRTTEPPPTTVFSRIKAPIRTNEHKTKETGESIPFEATGNLPHRPPTIPSKAEPINKSPDMERINEDETEETPQLRQSSGLLSNAFQTANGQQLKDHVNQIYAPNYGTHEMVPSYSRTFEELNSRDSTVGNEQNLVNAEGNQLQAKNVENENFYEDKLKQWTRKNDGVQSENSPRLEQKAPFHPDSAIRTTEAPPTTVFSRIKAPIRTNEHKTKETGESILFEATGNLPHRPPTVPSKAEPINESPGMERINEDETEETSQLRQSSANNAFQTANGQHIKGQVDHIYAPNYATHEKVPPYSRTFQKLNSEGHNHDTVGEIQDSRLSQNNQLRAKDAENPAKESTSLKETYEEKYNKLKQWVRENMKNPTMPESEGKHHEDQLAENVNNIIDSAAKINEKISDMVQNNVKDPNLLQMVRENDEKLRSLDDNQKNEYVVKLPNMKEFKTRLSPGAQSRLNKISDKPLINPYANKNPYETHPRRISEYKNGKWAYEKTKPKKPPYTTKHRVSEFVGKQAKNAGAPKTKVKEIEPVFIDAKLLDIDGSNDGGYVEPPRIPFDQLKVIDMSKMKGSLDMARNTNENHSPPPEALKPNLSPRTGQGEQENKKHDDKMIEGEKVMASDQPEMQNDATVGCSKEEEEQIYQLMHLHPIDYGGYRSSQREDSNHHLPSIKDLLIPKSRTSEHPSTSKNKAKSPDDKTSNQEKPTTESTQEMIDSLNKMHKHGRTISHEASNRQDFVPNQNEFGHPFDEPIEDEQYFPQDTPRFAPATFEEAMRMNPEFSQDQMNPNFIESAAFNKPRMMDQELIGSPAMENRLQDSVPEDLTNLGKFVPRNGEHMLSLHNRDVSEQDKLKNMYFVGDGIKLPLNMKEHHDGTLHLSVDVNSLCNCKHCTEKRLENGTVILEVPPSDMDGNKSTNEPRALEETTKKPTENVNKESDQSSESISLSSEEMQNLENQQLPEHNEDPKGDISKRSPRTKNSLQDNEIDLSQSEELVIPVRKLTRQQILDRLAEVEEQEKELEEDHKNEKINGQNDNHVNKNIKLFTNVLDFIKKLALDVRSKK